MGTVLYIKDFSYFTVKIPVPTPFASLSWKMIYLKSKKAETCLDQFCVHVGNFEELKFFLASHSSVLQTPDTYALQL